MTENGLAVEHPELKEERFAHRPLVGAMVRAQGRIAAFKERVRAYYFEVVLSPHQCPECGGRLQMTGQSLCSCSCGKTLDPTIAFQKSACCGARLVRRTFHYACSKCHEVVPSRFIFDERVFDSAYFREMMRESRARAKQRKEEIRQFLQDARSSTLPLLEEPNLESIYGLLEDLDLFVQQGSEDVPPCGFEPRQEFSMAQYRNHILSSLGWGAVGFSGIPSISEEGRRDRAWRFITLVFMQNDRMVDLIQEGDNIGQGNGTVSQLLGGKRLLWIDTRLGFLASLPASRAWSLFSCPNAAAQPRGPLCRLQTPGWVVTPILSPHRTFSDEQEG